jgi:hypothetical protein
MMASPTFMIINGLLIGFLCRIRRNDFEHLQAAFTDRGLLLLSVGHLLILGSHLPWYTTRFLSITDTVAVCMLVGPRLAVSLRPAARLALGIAAYTLSWVAVESWHPQGILLKATQETLFGSLDPTVYVYSFPILPWLGLDLAASALGSRIGDQHLRHDTKAMQRTLLRTGAIGLAAAVVINAIYHLSKYAAHGALMFPLHGFASPFQKDPPGLDYVLFYGSFGMCLLAASIQLLQHEYVPWLTRRMANLGQTSFVVFVFQFYVYLTVLAPIRMYLPLRSAAWPLYLFASIVVIVLPALAWHRRGYNRFLTVGYRYLQKTSWNVPLKFGSGWVASGTIRDAATSRAE